MPNINDFHSFATAAVGPGGMGDTACARISDDRRNPVVGQVWQRMGSRSDAFKTQNMAARRDFLDAIKRAFAVDSIRNIPKKVLEELKLDDFALDEHERVMSDKPLTARRILAVTTKINQLVTLEQRVAEFRRTAAPALNDGCVKDLVALAESRQLGSAETLVEFFTAHFAKVGDKLAKVMVKSAADRAAFCDAVAEDLLSAVGGAIVRAGLKREHLTPIKRALRNFAQHAVGGQTLWAELARTFATKLEAASKEIANASFRTRTDAMEARASNVRLREINGNFSDRIRSEHGRDIMLRSALDRLDRIDILNDEDRTLTNKLLVYLARHTAEMGRERTFLWIRRLQAVMTGGEDGVDRMMVRQALGEVLKGYSDLTEADVKELSTTQLFDFSLAAADDALANSRTRITRYVKNRADEAMRHHYTNAETREMMALANMPAPEEPAKIPVAPPLPVPGKEKESAAVFLANKAVCNSLTLLGKLLHREDGWKEDEDPAASVRETLTKNAELVRSLVENWNKGEVSLESFSTTVAVALSLAFRTEVPFAGSLKAVNMAILAYVEAADDGARNDACTRIAEQLNRFASGFSEGLQNMMTANLRPILTGAGMGGNFQNLPDGVDPAHANLLELARSKHPQPRNETTEQRKEREAAILSDYSKLVVDPEAGGFGTLINELASHYVAALDVREQRSMLSGALLAIDPTMMTDLLQGHTVFEIIQMAKPKFLNGEGKADEVKKMLVPKDVKKLTPAQRGAAGKVTGGILKGAGPVLQKMVQMIGVQNMPVFLQDAIRDCKSDLKPIPSDYVQAKLNEVVRRSNGKIVAISNPQSIGAASIAQAFKCTLTDSDGRQRTVVVKMLRPDVRGRMEREIAAIRRSVAGAGDGALRTLNARINSLLGELDFAVERANIGECQPIYGESPYSSLRSVREAEGCPQLPDVLVMEEAPGTTFQRYMDDTTARLNSLLEGKVKQDENGHYQFVAIDPEVHRQLDADLRTMYADVRKRQANLQRLVEVWFSNAIYGTGKFHGDLHGGNIMVDAEGNLTVIDFGNAPTFSKGDRDSIVKMIVSALRGKPEAVLDAVAKLVSRESQTVLREHRNDLIRTLRAMFAAGSMENAESRLTIVFGELARVGVEVPESLYNFVEAFGRLQQLSESMEKTLTRISGAVPYMREHADDEHFPVEELYGLSPVDYPEYRRTPDEIIDSVLTDAINDIREDSPRLGEPEVFKRLADKIADGEFNRKFDSYGSDNPVSATVVKLFGYSVSHSTINQKISETHPEVVHLIDNNPNFRQVDYTNPHTAAAMREIVSNNIDRVYGPYLRRNPRLAPLLERMHAMTDRMFSDENVTSGLYREFNLDMSPEILSGEEGDKVIFDADRRFAAYQEDGLLTEEQARIVSDLNAEYALLVRDELMPEIARVFKDGINGMLDVFRLDGFAAPVKMGSTLKDSAFGHIFKTLWLGGSGAFALGANYLWHSAFDGKVEIRANFDVTLADFRDFASGEEGRVKANSAKGMELADTKPVATVHNAEARRALVERLISDRHVTSAEFYASPEGRRVGALLGLDEKETMNNVEKAMPLTTGLLRQILAVHDLAKADRTPGSLRALTGFFGRPNLEDVTYEDFTQATNRVFSTLLHQNDPAAALGVEPERLETFLKANYGKALARMSEIAAADPTAARLGTAPSPLQLQRWFVAALVETVRDDDGMRRRNLKLEDLLGAGVNVGRGAVDALMLDPKSALLTALRLHGLDGEEAVTVETGFVTELRNEVTAKAFRKAPEQEELEEYAVARDELVPPPAEGAERTEAELEAVHAAARLGYGVVAIAGDAELYARYKANPDDQNVIDEIRKRVRRSLYAKPAKVPLDPEVESQKVLDFFAAKLEAEPKNVFQWFFGGLKNIL